MAGASDDQAKLHAAPAQTEANQHIRQTARDDVGRQLEQAGQRIRRAAEDGQMNAAEAWAAWYAARDQILAEAVASGAFTEAQAAACRNEIHKAELSERLRDAGQRIETAAENGEMTEDEAWTEWYAVKDQLINDALETGQITADDAAAFHYEIHKFELGDRLNTAGQRLDQAVESGELTEDEAWDKWYAMKYDLIDTAVASGEITEADAATFHHEIHKAELRDRLETTGGRLKEAVIAGQMNEADAWAEWYATKDELIASAVAAGEITEQDAAHFHRQMHQAELKERIEGAGERIHDAVAAGEMSDEEGRAAWAVAREALIAEAVEAGEISEHAADEFRLGYDRDEVGRRLKAAVVSGAMSEQEAFDAWLAYSSGAEDIAAALEAMIQRGEISLAQAEAKMQAVQSAAGAGVGKTGKSRHLDARDVLRAVQRIRLTDEQKTAVREIERDTARVYREIRRRDKDAHTELAERVKAELTKLLDEQQVEQFDRALERLTSDRRRPEKPERK